MKDQKKKTTPVRKETTKSPEGFSLKFPLLWLTGIVLVLYIPTINLGFTELDDSIFIKEMHAYNENPSNLIKSFKRGVFNETQDTYYRPLLLDSFVLNYQVSGTDIKGYHVVNILLHLACVLLLYIFFRKLRMQVLPSFLLTLIFAVHPVLLQAVAWIPGRNDTLLGVFTLLFLILSVNFSNDGKTLAFAGSFLSLLAALFTKETAVFAAPVAFLILVLILKKHWLDKRSIILYVSWIIALITWFLIRSQATLKEGELQPGDLLMSMPGRLPVLLQYLGKIVLPVNLSVFPIVEDTSIIYGLISIVLLGAGIYFAKEKDWQIIVTGFLVYILFLIPALLVPNTLNDQSFEHRLYLSMIGILLVISQTILFKYQWGPRNQFFSVAAIALVLVIMNFSRQKFFNDPVSFWKEAVRTSPHSAYANMMLGARIDKEDQQEADLLLRKAYALNPDEKYINYYMGKLLLDKDSLDKAEKHFQREIEISDYFECYFHMARIAFSKNEFDTSIAYLLHFLSLSPNDPQGNNNLLLLYMQTHQTEKAREQVKKMQQLGLPVPPEAAQL